MRKKVFYIAVIVFSALCLISVVLSYTTSIAEGEISGAIGGNLMSVIMLFQIKYALKPIKEFGSRNPIKGFFHSIGKAGTYRKICIVLFIVFALIGISNFSKGLIKLFM